MDRKGKVHIGLHVPLTLGAGHHHHHHHHHQQLHQVPQPPVINVCPSAPPAQLNTSIVDGHVWVPTTSHTCSSLEYKAVHVGNDANGSPIYVGRTHYNGEIIPCKVIPRLNAAYFPYDCRENQAIHFEMLCRNYPRINWVHSSGGYVPPGAIPVGHTSTGEALYAGRVHHQGALTVGKVHPSHRNCYISFAGQEIPYSSYEVMVLVHD